MTIFNQVLVERRKTNSIGNIKNSDFYRFIYSDLMQRLEPINRTFKEGIVLGFGNYPVFPINNSYCLKYENIEHLVLIEKKSINYLDFYRQILLKNFQTRLSKKIITILSE